MVDLSVQVGSLTLQNPIMPGSGCINERLADFIDFNRLGAIVVKTITPGARLGNPPPRVVEFRDAVLWNIGLPNKGPEAFVKDTVGFFSAFDSPMIASISADTAAEFGELARAISVPGVAAIEANISCPNLEANGRAFAQDAAATYDVIRAMRAASPLPVWAKLTANVGDVTEIARSVERAGAEAVIVAHGFLGMAIDIGTRRPKLGALTGGLTGPALKPLVMRLVFQTARAVGIPVIATGGASTAEDVIEYMLAGATAVQIGTANFLHTTTMTDVIDGLEAYCEHAAVQRIADLVGAVIVNERLLNRSGTRQAALVEVADGV